MEWYHWLIIIGIFILGVKIGRSIANGRSIRWQELKTGYYTILVIEPGWRKCALIQEELFLYEPLSVRLPREKEVELNPGDEFQILRQDGQPVFLIKKKEQPKQEIAKQETKDVKIGPEC